AYAKHGLRGSRVLTSPQIGPMLSRRAAASAAVLVLCAAPLGAASHDLAGSLQLLAKGGKLIDKSADVRGAVVWFRPQAGVRAVQSNRTYEMVTVKKEFMPHVLAVPLGARVSFPNQDPILHNVFSLSTDNRFDLGLYRK